jgi:hypothetical protein
VAKVDKKIIPQQFFQDFLFLRLRVFALFAFSIFPDCFVPRNDGTSSRSGVPYGTQTYHAGNATTKLRFLDTILVI